MPPELAVRSDFFFNLTCGFLLIQPRFSEVVILVSGKTILVGLSFWRTVLFTEFMGFGASSAVCHLDGKDLQLRMRPCAGFDEGFGRIVAVLPAVLTW